MGTDSEAKSGKPRKTGSTLSPGAEDATASAEKVRTMFSIICFDKPDQARVRDEHRSAHLAYLQSFKHRIVLAGPLRAEDGSRSVGAVLIMDLEDRAAAEAFAGDDPYNKAGIFESVIIRPFRKVFPEA